MIAVGLLAASKPSTADDGPSEPDDLDRISGTLSRDGLAVQRWLEREYATIAAAMQDAARNGDPAAMPAQFRDAARRHLLGNHLRPLLDEPSSRSPLNVRTVGTIERDRYTIDKVIYESQPGYWVTASLYRPREDAARATRTDAGLPAVLGVCGHAVAAKAYETYQAAAQSLAVNGFVCLVIDPVGQGERLITPKQTDDGWRSAYGGGTSQHNEFGLRAGLAGVHFGGWRAYDGIRGIDLLASLPEVDDLRIGVQGHSGGGTMTTWLTSLDDRIAFSAASCFVTSFYTNLVNQLPADAEQCPPSTQHRDNAATRLDHWHYLAANAPNPVLVIAQRDDFFDVRGAYGAFLELDRFYGRLGAGGRAGWYVGDGSHGYHAGAREAMVRFFRSAAGAEGLFASAEPIIEDEQTLRCTESGQVEVEGSKPTFAFLPELVTAAKARLGDAAGASSAQAIRETLAIDTGAESAVDSATNRPAVLRPMYAAAPFRFRSRYALRSADGIRPIVTRVGDRPLPAMPSPEAATAVLYVADRASAAELNDPPPALTTAIERAGNSGRLYAVDVRGVGELQPRVGDRSSVRDIYGSDYFHAAHAEMLGLPMLGRRVLDAEAALRWIATLHPRVVLAGHGAAVPVVNVLAAVASDETAGMIESAVVSGGFETFAAVATSDTGLPPYSVLPFGVLETFDLNDLTVPNLVVADEPSSE